MYKESKIAVATYKRAHDFGSHESLLAGVAHINIDQGFIRVPQEKHNARVRAALVDLGHELFMKPDMGRNSYFYRCKPDAVALSSPGEVVEGVVFHDRGQPLAYVHDARHHREIQGALRELGYVYSHKKRGPTGMYRHYYTPPEVPG